MNTVAKEIDPFSLPCVGIRSKGMLPKESGIYFAIAGTDILYIGMATNLQQRWRAGHHRYQQLESYDDVVIAWLVITNPMHRELEIAEETYISRFNPTLNGLERPKEFVRKPLERLSLETLSAYKRRVYGLV